MEPLTLTHLADLFSAVSLILGSMICFGLGFIGGILR
jgi:hypothetical protein